MHALKTIPRQRIVVGVTLAALAAAALIWLQLARQEQVMQSRGYGIVSYQLAFTAPQAGQILDAWGPDGQQAARRSLLIDFAFMPAYGLLFAGVTLLVARRQAGWIQSAGFALTPAPLAAIAFDVLENALLLSNLGSGGAFLPAAPLVAGVAASAKFALLALVILYWLAGAASLALRGIRGTPL